MSGSQWILHVLGIDTQQSYYYDFWSGIGPVLFAQLPLLVAFVTFIIRHNCHVKHCWRMGHIDPEVHHPACKRHHSHGHKLGGTK